MAINPAFLRWIGRGVWQKGGKAQSRAPAAILRLQPNCRKEPKRAVNRDRPLCNCAWFPAIGQFASHAATETRSHAMSWVHTIDPLYSLSGFLVGALVGMTGVGGGSLMTPLLILLFGIHPATAVGTDLLYAAATKTGGTLIHGFPGPSTGRSLAGSRPAACRPAPSACSFCRALI